jgi:thioredoxin-like negative regulator of GroEL
MMNHLFLLISLVLAAASSVEGFASTAVLPKGFGFSPTCSTSSSRSETNRKSSALAALGSDPMIDTIESNADWMEQVLSDHQGDDQVTVVNFHSKFCKSCQQFDGVYRRKYVRKYGKEPSNFSFASVEWTKNKSFCKTLNIKALPTVQFYYRGQLLTSLTGGAKLCKQYTETFDYYDAATPKELRFDAHLQAKKELLEAALLDFEWENDTTNELEASEQLQDVSR